MFNKHRCSLGLFLLILVALAVVSTRELWHYGGVIVRDCSPESVSNVVGFALATMTLYATIVFCAMDIRANTSDRQKSD